MLQVINLENVATAQPSSNLFPATSEFKPDYHGILRVGIGVSMWLAIGRETRVQIDRRARHRLFFSSDSSVLDLRHLLPTFHRRSSDQFHRSMFRVEYQCVHSDGEAVRILPARPVASWCGRCEHEGHADAFRTRIECHDWQPRLATELDRSDLHRSSGSNVSFAVRCTAEKLSGNTRTGHRVYGDDDAFSLW